MKILLTQISTKLFLFLTCIYVCVACGQKKIESKIFDNQGDTTKIVTEKDTLQMINNEANRELGFDNIESLEDTLKKYRQEKAIKILNCAEGVGCYFEIRIGNFLKNGKKNAVIIIENSGELFVYNLENDKWLRIFEIEGDFACGYNAGKETIKFEDINGDNKIDILAVAHVNYSTMVWYDLYLYQIKGKIWERIPFFYQEIPNPKFNHQNNLLYSYFYGSNYAEQSRSLYYWKGNQFLLKSAVTQQIIYKDEDNYLVKHFVGKNGKKILQKEYKSKISVIDSLVFSLQEFENIK